MASSSETAPRHGIGRGPPQARSRSPSPASRPARSPQHQPQFPLAQRAGASARGPSPRSPCSPPALPSSPSPLSSWSPSAVSAQPSSACPHPDSILCHYCDPDPSYILHDRILPPRPSSPSSDCIPSPLPLLLSSAPSTPREDAPSRFSFNSLTRAATLKVQHVRSQSASSLLGPLGFSSASSSNSSPNTYNRDPNQSNQSPQQSLQSKGAFVLSTLFNRQLDTMSRKLSNAGLIGIGYTGHDTTSTALGGLPQTTDLIDEFAGLSFPAIFKEYLQEPPEDVTPSSPADALKRTPEGRLVDLVDTATALLERVYSAYKARTATLADALGEVECVKEEAANTQTRSENLKAQLDRLAQEERAHREAEEQRLAEHTKRIQELEAELARERRRRDAIEEETRRRRGKRASAASDSGFESDTADAESCFSRDDAGDEFYASSAMTTAPTRLSIASPVAESTTATVTVVGPAPPKNPTPLRETWSSDAAPQQTTRWSLFGRKRDPEPATDVLRSENRQLRARVRELEGAVDMALEAVHGRLGLVQ